MDYGKTTRNKSIALIISCAYLRHVDFIGFLFFPIFFSSALNWCWSFLQILCLHHFIFFFFFDFIIFAQCRKQTNNKKKSIKSWLHRIKPKKICSSAQFAHETSAWSWMQIINAHLSAIRLVTRLRAIFMHEFSSR